jgi:hypothetical protein
MPSPLPSRIALGCLLAVAGNLSAFAQTGPTSVACPFAAPEIRQSLGIEVKQINELPRMPYPGGRKLSCRYEAVGAAPTIWVNQIAMDERGSPAIVEAFQQRASQRAAIPGDPDGAGYPTDQGEHTHATVQYLRQGTLVEVRVMMGPKDPAFEAMKAKLAALRRVP